VCVELEKDGEVFTCFVEAGVAVKLANGMKYYIYIYTCRKEVH
jgi:hypothetical protein